MSHVHMLAQAVAVQSAELFSHSMQWTHESFKSRGVDEADLLQNTRCLREVLVKELPQPVADAATVLVDSAITELADSTPHADSEPAFSAEADERARTLKYLEAILEGDRGAAESIVLEAVEAGLSVPEVYERILAPAQARLGRMWHRGEISIADEHFGSATTVSVMSQLRPHFRRAPSNGRVVVATSTPGDLHDIGLRMVADLFEIDGWKVLYLGANTPTADVIEMLERRQPHLLALAVSTGLTLRDAGVLIAMVRGTEGIAATKILIGGPPFRTIGNLWEALGADGCASSATDAVGVGRRLVGD
jgi:methanogenic corrinoid protein MtbC1